MVRNDCFGGAIVTFHKLPFNEYNISITFWSCFQKSIRSSDKVSTFQENSIALVINFTLLNVAIWVISCYRTFWDAFDGFKEKVAWQYILRVKVLSIKISHLSWTTIAYLIFNFLYKYQIYNVASTMFGVIMLSELRSV